MSLSGSNTGSLLPYTAQDLLEEACSRAGIPPEAITGELVEKFFRQLNLFFTSLLNRGIQLWKRQSLILPCYQGRSQMPVPPGYNLVTNVTRRTLSRQIGSSFFTTAGGTAEYAFDDDFDTICTQTSLNGAIGCQFDSETVVTTVGILSGGAGEYAFFFEYSDDGVTYTAVDSGDATFTAAGQWAWFDLDGSPVSGATYWRVRAVGDAVFSAAEIFFGNTPSEVPLGPAWNLDTYANMPNKTQPGQVTNWYQQRNQNAVTLYVWPVPNSGAKYDQLVLWATQYLDQVTAITQSLDLPLRWYEAATAKMAVYVCNTDKQADRSRLPGLMQDAAEQLWLAESEERDPSPTQYDLGLEYYTR